MTQSATLSLTTIDYPFESLIQRATSKPRKLILNPEFQRDYKWDKDGWARASKFIESCLMRIPLPSCYFAEDENRAHLVIDGVQRITTIMRFMNDEFALEGMTAFPDLEGKKFSELGTLASDLETTTIRCVVLRNENPKELIAEIFSRLNQGAVKLSDQEIRHALFAGDFDDLLNELSQIEAIKLFKVPKGGENQNNSREGEELVLRYFAFSEDGENYSGNLSKFLDNFMEKGASFNPERIEALKQSFHSSLEACQLIFAKDELFTNIASSRKRQGIVYYDLLMNSLGEIDPTDLVKKKASIRTAYSELCESSEFARLTAGGVQRLTSVSRRNQLWEHKLRAALS